VSPRPLLLAAAVLAGCSGSRRGPCDPSPPRGALGTVCGFQDPEDVAGVPSAGVVLVSNMATDRAGGFLAVLPIGGGDPIRLWPPGDAEPDSAVGDPACPGPPGDDLAPHGLDVAPGPPVRVAVVAHAPRESIELFDLEGTGGRARLVWRGCVPFLPGRRANDVAIAPDGELVASNWLPAGALGGLWGAVAGGLGRATGDVVAWRRETGWRHLPGTAAAQPNGVAVSADGADVFYAETGTGRVVRVPRAGLAAGAAGVHADVPGRPDNLSWGRGDQLLVASHTSGLEMFGCLAGRRPCRSPWAVTSIDPATLGTREILRDDGEVVGSVTAAADVYNCTYLGARYSDRVGVRCKQGEP
jgi:hypothetical protein